MREEIKWAQMAPPTDEEAYQRLGKSLEQVKKSVLQLAEEGYKAYRQALVIYANDIFLAEIYMSGDSQYMTASSELSEVLALGMRRYTHLQNMGIGVDHYIEKMKGDASERGIKIANFRWTDIPRHLDEVDNALEQITEVDGKTRAVFERMRDRLAYLTVPQMPQL